MSGPAPTIIDLKTSFLRQQIRLLSQPLKPSPKYLTSIESEENALRQKSVDAALYKLNGLLRKHIKLSYGPQSLRHVAEQVDALFWNAGEGAAFGEGEVGEEWAERGTDLTREVIIEQLPEQWSEEAETRALEQATRYRDLQAKLVALNEKRRVARERLLQYKAAKEMLDPFEGEEAKLQDNLVTKNGELEKELDRMRMLMFRVERGLEKLDRSGRADDDDGDGMDLDVEDEAGKRLLAIL